MIERGSQKGPPPLPKSRLRRAMRWMIALGVLLACALAAFWAYSAGYHQRALGWYRCRRLVKQIGQPLAECKSLLEECEREVQQFTSHMERLARGFSLRERMDQVLAPLVQPEDGPEIVTGDQIERARTAVRAACEKTTAEAASARQKPRAALEQVDAALTRLENEIAGSGGVRRLFRIAEPASWGFLAESLEPGRASHEVFLDLSGQYGSGEVLSGLFVELGAFRLRYAGRKTEVVVFAQSADMVRHSETLMEIEPQAGRLRRQMETARQRVDSVVASEGSALQNELAHFERVRQAQRAYLNASFESACELARALPSGTYTRRHQVTFLAAVEAVGRHLARQAPAVAPQPAAVAPGDYRGRRRGRAPPPRAPAVPASEGPAVQETASPERREREVRAVAVWGGTVVVDIGSVDAVEPGTMLIAEMRECPVQDPRNPVRILGYEVSSLRVQRTHRTLSLCRPARAMDRLPHAGDAVRLGLAR